KPGSGYTITTANNHSLTNAASSALNIAAGTAVSLALSGQSSQSAGGTNTLTITAQDAAGYTAAGYTGDHALTFAGAGTAPGGTRPTVTDKTGAAVNFGAATTVAFTNGVSTAGGAMRLYKTENATITAS